MADRYGGSKSADRLLVDNHDPAINAVKVLQEVTSGVQAAFHAENWNTTAGSKSLLVKGGADLISAKTLADVEQFKVDQSGNVTAAGTLSSGGQLVADRELLTHPVPALAATMPRLRANAAQGTMTSGTVYLTALAMPAGLTVSNCTMFVNATAKTNGTHGWYVLTDSSRNVVAVTADQTDPGTVWGAPSTGYALPFTAAYTTIYTGLYYVGVMVTQSSGTQVLFTGGNSVAGGIAAGTGITNTVTLAGSSSSSQTTPPALASQLTSITSGGTFVLYAYLT